MALPLIDTFWRFFISLRLTFVLLAILGLGAFLGMSFDQTLSFEEFTSTLPTESFYAFMLNFFELGDAFHSWWFSLALLFLSANLIACSIERLPRIFFDALKARPYLTDRRLAGLTLKHEIITQNNQEQILQKFFDNKKNNFLAKYNNNTFYFTQEHVSGRFGVYVVHIALLIIMYSSMYTTYNGIDGHVLIDKGSKTRFITAKGAGGVSYTHDLGFYIGCDDFRLRTFVDNSPMEFESDLYVSHDQDKLHAKTVRVNEPLSYNNYTFYQATYKPLDSEKLVELVISDRQGKQERYKQRLNSEIKLANGDILMPEKLYEDFAGLGQALRMSKKSRDQDPTYFHIFRQYPDFDKEIRDDAYSIKLLETDQNYATGLSIGYVPGISVIFSGFALLLVGLYMCFFMNPMRYFARVEEGPLGRKILLAAQGFRHQSQVRREFERRITSLKPLCR